MLGLGLLRLKFLTILALKPQARPRLAVHRLAIQGLGLELET